MTGRELAVRVWRAWQLARNPIQPPPPPPLLGSILVDDSVTFPVYRLGLERAKLAVVGTLLCPDVGTSMRVAKLPREFTYRLFDANAGLILSGYERRFGAWPHLAIADTLELTVRLDVTDKATVEYAERFPRRGW